MIWIQHNLFHSKSILYAPDIMFWSNFQTTKIIKVDVVGTPSQQFVHSLNVWLGMWLCLWGTMVGSNLSHYYWLVYGGFLLVHWLLWWTNEGETGGLIGCYHVASSYLKKISLYPDWASVGFEQQIYRVVAQCSSTVPQVFLNIYGRGALYKVYNDHICGRGLS